MTEVSTAPVQSPTRRLAPAWVAVALLLLGAGLGFSSILAWIHGAWYSFVGVSAYSHGYLVLGLSIWMGYVHLRQAPPAELRPDWLAIVPLIGVLSVLAVAEWWGINSSRALVLPPLLLVSVAFVFGRPAAHRLMVPAAFLYFGLLPWWMLRPMLQDLATNVVGAVLKLNGIPVFIDGNLIQIPAGTFVIVSACSGLSFLISALTVVTYYALMYLRQLPNQLLLIAAGIVAAIFSNWVRIYSLILIGEYSAMQHPLIGEHYVYGWVLFVLAMAPVLVLAMRLERREERSLAAAPPASRAQANGGTHQTAQSNGFTQNGAPNTVARKSIVVAAAIAGALYLVPQIFGG